MVRLIYEIAVVDLRWPRGTRAPLGAKILSISCSFWENMAKLYVSARATPPPRELAPPPRGNPGSATKLNIICDHKVQKSVHTD